MTVRVKAPFDRIRAVAGGQLSLPQDRRPLPPHIEKILAKIGLHRPIGDERIPIAKLDDALRGVPFELRFAFKDDLRAAGLI